MINKLWILGAVIVIGGAGWWLSRGSADAPVPTNEANQAETQSLKNLLTRTGSWQCQLRQEVQGTTTSGTVYVSDGKIRGDFQSTVPQYQSPIKSHILVRDGYAFNWTDLSKSGIKVASAQLDASGKPQPNQSDTSVDLYNQDLGYQCSTWSVDQSKFEIPADINFTGF